MTPPLPYLRNFWLYLTPPPHAAAKRFFRFLRSFHAGAPEARPTAMSEEANRRFLGGQKRGPKTNDDKSTQPTHDTWFGCLMWFWWDVCFLTDYLKTHNTLTKLLELTYRHTAAMTAATVTAMGLPPLRQHNRMPMTTTAVLPLLTCSRPWRRWMMTPGRSFERQGP